MGYRRFELPAFDPSTASLEEQFHHEMLRIYVVARDRAGYSAKRFLRSVKRHGGLVHAKRALARSSVNQTGLVRLKNEGLLSISMENVVLRPEFRSLFNEREIEEARRRLRALA